MDGEMEDAHDNPLNPTVSAPPRSAPFSKRPPLDLHKRLLPFRFLTPPALLRRT
jgi:hypothetical protein